MKVKCLSKNRNNKGVIVSYNLQDETGRQFQATGQQIKEEIMKGQFEFVNLQIDTAGRLVDKAVEKPKKIIDSKNKVRMTGVLKVISKEEKKKTTPKDVVKEFLSHINETYNDKISGVDTCEQFINDYTGKGNVAWDEELERGCIKVKMPKEVKVYFKTLVDSIERQARESYVTLYDPFEEEATLEDLLNNSHLPEKVVKFQKNTKCDFGIIKGLFKCVDKEDIARIRVQDDNCYINWMYDSEMLTANYEYARKYFKSALGLVVEFNEEVHSMDVEVNGNDIAQVFYIKYLAELSGRDLEFYKQQIIKKVKEFVESTRVQQSYRDVDVNVKIALQWALFGSLPDINRLDCIDKECRTFAAAYMALKHNVICHGDDDTNYYDYVKKEINELNKLV